MLGRVQFVIRYALRSIQKNRERSALAVLCIAVGVASIVALQLLALSIQRTLAVDPRLILGADIVVNTLEPGQRAAIEQAAQGATLAETFQQSLQIKFGGTVAITTLRAFDPQQFPLTGPLPVLDPLGASLATLLGSQHGDSLVQAAVTTNLAARLGLHTGDIATFWAGNVPRSVRIVALIPANSENPNGFDDFTVNGYAVVPLDQVGALTGSTPQPNKIYIAASDPPQVMQRLRAITPPLSLESAADVAVGTERTASLISRLLLYVGMMALLVGGIGIINTMSLLVSRRTTEIATLKMLGISGELVIGFFVMEAGIIGLAGSICGVGGGVLLSMALLQIAAAFIGRPLIWTPDPGALLFGVLAGLLVATIFGVLPVLAAGRVRPSSILRQGLTLLPKLHPLVLAPIVLVITVVLGGIAGLLVSDLLLGELLAFGTLVLFGGIVLVLFVMVWCISVLPDFGNVSLRMALRSLSRRRIRTAVTLMALSMGIFAMGVIFTLAAGLKESIHQAIGNGTGFDIVVNIADAEGLTTGSVRRMLGEMPGVAEVSAAQNVNARIIALNNRPVQMAPDRQIPVSGRDIQSDHSVSKDIVRGRGLNLGDHDQPMAVVEEQYAREYGLKPGDKITLRLLGENATELTCEIAGIYRQPAFSLRIGDGIILSNEVLLPALGWPDSIPSFYVLTSASSDIVTGRINTQLPAAYAVNVQTYSSLFDTLIDQFSIFPLLLAALSLFAGVVMIANNVGIAVVERRYDIGVMKAVGAQNGRVMQMLLLENGLVGLFGGILGATMALLGAAFITISADLPAMVSPSIWFGLILLSLVIVLPTTVLAAWSAVRERPMEVLRYV